MVVVAAVVMTGASLIYWDDTWPDSVINAVAILAALVALLSLCVGRRSP